MKEQFCRNPEEAAMASPDYCFPNQSGSGAGPAVGCKKKSEDSKASYYLGNYWYHVRNYDQAIACWEKSARYDDGFPTVHRNLALAYYNKKKDAAS